MEDKFILELINAFNSSSAVSMKVKQGETSITLKKEEAFATKNVVSVPAQTVLPQVMPQSVPVATSLQQDNSQNLANTDVAPNEISVSKVSNVNSVLQNESANVIKSPIVGTFYRAPSPDAPVYCEVGKSIKKGEPICILEAMKMMNTLEAEYDCIIEEILVANGELVEFDQPIFKVKKV